MPDLRSTARRGFNALGYDLRKLSGELGQNAFLDMRALSGHRAGTVVADVGANIGQTVHRLRASLDAPVIHAFEPGPSTFAELERRTAGIPDLFLTNCALGAEAGTLELNQNTHSDMSSFLEIGADGWGEVQAKTPVEIKPLDEYCAERSIEYLDVLKSDTQGYDLEVLKGAKTLLAERRIQLVFIELNLNESYEGLPRLDTIIGFLLDHGFHLVSFYNFHYQNDRASWADALFICPDFVGRA
jgi:FkbM family methyltransferase